MSRIHIEFVNQSKLNRLQWSVLSALIFALISLAVLAAQRASKVVQLEEQNAQLATARGLAVVPAVTHKAIPAPQLLATNMAITSLNTPWTSILSGLDESKPEEVALLELESRPSEHRIRIVADAEKPNDLFDFIDALQKHAPFRRVIPTSQETLEPAPGSNIVRTRLMFEVEWQ